MIVHVYTCLYNYVTCCSHPECASVKVVEYMSTDYSVVVVHVGVHVGVHVYLYCSNVVE